MQPEGREAGSALPAPEPRSSGYRFSLRVTLKSQRYFYAHRCIQHRDPRGKGCTERSTDALQNKRPNQALEDPGGSGAHLQ